MISGWALFTEIITEVEKFYLVGSNLKDKKLLVLLFFLRLIAFTLGKNQILYLLGY